MNAHAHQIISTQADANASRLCAQVGRAIRNCRLAMGLSPKDLAEDIGKSQRYIVQIENGELDFELTILGRIACALQIELSELLLIADGESLPVLIVAGEENENATDMRAY